MDAATKRAMHGSCARVRRRRQNFRPALAIRHEPAIILLLGLVAQWVEQRIENPCVGGSIPPRATKNSVKQNANPCRLAFLFALAVPATHCNTYRFFNIRRACAGELPMWPPCPSVNFVIFL